MAQRSLVSHDRELRRKVRSERKRLAREAWLERRRLRRARREGTGAEAGLAASQDGPLMPRGGSPAPEVPLVRDNRPVSAGGAAAGDFDAATAELKVLAEEIRDRSDLMIRVGLGTAEDEAAYSEALEALEEIELRALRREEARHAVWLRGIGEELRLARLFGTRPEIYRKGLSVRQKAVLIRRLGREGYLSLPFSMGDRRGAL